MRKFVVATVTLVVVLAGGCSGDGDSTGSADRQGNGASGEVSPSDPETPDAPSGSADPDVADSEACAEVRTGIDAFNVGDFEETVEHFEKALPLAEAQDDGSEPASDLIEAVRYYAELDPELYLDASQNSPDFAKYKAITLSQCAQGEDDTPDLET